MQSHGHTNNAAMRWPLRRQIMLPMAAIMLLTVSAVSGAGALLALRATKARIAAQIVEVTKILDASNFPLTDAVLRQMQALCGAKLVLVDDAGKVVAASGAVGSRFLRGTAQGTSVAKSFALGDHEWTRNNGYFHTTIDLTNSRREDGPSVLHVLYPEDEYQRAWQRAVYPSVGFVLFALPVTMLLSGVTANQISARVGRLQQRVERIARGDFKRLTVSERDDEIRALGEAVNRMSSMLSQYERDVRSTERMRTLALLGGGIAHQLRNSATGCAIALDLHEEECPLGQSCESLNVAKRQLRLMEEYLQRFLRLGNPQESTDNEAIDFDALVGELIPLVQPAARHGGVDLQWQAGPVAITVTGNPQSLNQLIINLMLNAIEAAAHEKVRTGAPGSVRVSLKQIPPNRCVLSVDDTGRGPSAAIEDQLFDAFATNKPDGVGLGLAVAQKIAEQHGGKICWERKENVTRFMVELPCQVSESEIVYAIGR